MNGAAKRFDIPMIPGIGIDALELVLPRIKFEPVLGTYDWTLLDHWIGEAAKLNVPLILGVTPNDPYGYDRSDPDPEGAYFVFKGNGMKRWVPFENHSSYQVGLRNFHMALSKHAGGSFQIQGRYGTFGEGTNKGFHNSGVPEITDTTAQAIVAMYRECHPNAQQWAMGDNPVGVKEAMKDPGTGVLVASFGKPLCDDRFAEIAYLIGPPGSRPVACEYYSPGLTAAEMDTANLQITRWKARLVHIYNYPTGQEVKVTEGVRLAKLNVSQGSPI